MAHRNATSQILQHELQSANAIRLAGGSLNVFTITLWIMAAVWLQALDAHTIVNRTISSHHKSTRRVQTSAKENPVWICSPYPEY